MLERGLKLDQAHVDINHLKILLAVELLPKYDVCGVEKHYPLILLGHFSECCTFGVSKNGEVYDFCVQLSIGLVTIILRVVADALVLENQLFFLLFDRFEI